MISSWRLAARSASATGATDGEIDPDTSDSGMVPDRAIAPGGSAQTIRDRLARVVGCAVGLAAAWTVGCADLHYDRIELGQPKEAYERVLPAEAARRTDLGIAWLATDMTGRTDAVVVLAARDRRAAAKFHATWVRRNYGWKTETGFWLRGELNPELADLSATGPIDTVRWIAERLASYRGEKSATEAHSWIAAGLVRFLQRWPHLSDQIRTPKVDAAFLDRVPPGGTASIVIDESGVYHFDYRQGVPSGGKR